MKKISTVLSLFLLLILIANMSFAAGSYDRVQMSVVEEPVCTIELGENSKFEKRLIEKDLTNKEVTLQLKVTNEELPQKVTGELILVIDNSLSMDSEVSTGTTRKDLVFDSAKKLVSTLLQDNDNLKIGLVSFSTNTDMAKEGSIEDAAVVSPLSNNATDLNNAITNIPANGPRTNLDAGLTLGAGQFTKSDVNKYMIVLTDGVPNVSIDNNNPYYSDATIDKTKQTLTSIGSQNINLTTMLTGITDENLVPNGTTKSYAQIIEEVFGTPENPTAGVFHYVTDDKVEQIITEDIYNSLLPINKTLTDIKIVDYFPQEIIDNFDFAYVTQANIGTISTSVDTTNNSITWTIPELAVGETAVVTYKLKLKENFNERIVGDILNTNEKVDLEYKDFDDEVVTKTSDITPKLKLALPPVELPKAGTIVFVTGILAVVLLLVFSFLKYRNLNNSMKH